MVKFWLFSLFIFSNFLGHTSLGQYSAKNYISVSLGCSVSSIQPGEEAWLVVEVQLEPGWHAYWKTAGETGFPTKIEWDLPDGVSVSPLIFPAPKYYQFQGLGSFVHENTFFLITKLELDNTIDSNSTIEIKGLFSTLVCDDSSCIPFRTDIGVNIQINNHTIEDQLVTAKLEKAKANLPVQLEDPDTGMIKVSDKSIDFFLRSEDMKSYETESFYFFPESDLIDPSGEQVFFYDTNTSTLGVKLKRNPSIAYPEGIKGVLTHGEKKKAWLIDLPIGSAFYGTTGGAGSIPDKIDAKSAHLDYQVLWLLLAFVLLALAAWIYGKTNQPHHGQNKKILGLLLSILTIGLAIWIGYPREEASLEGIVWQEWSPELENTLRDQGKGVYVDFTAKWCLSCQVNKRVFQSDEIITYFHKQEIVPLVADWTKRGPMILAALQKHGREGVPLNIFYPPNQEGVLLPEILSEDIVLTVLQTGKPYLGSEEVGFTGILIFALLGGLILNLMPCVFPVIGLKIMSFVKQAGEDPSRIKKHGVFFSFGVLLSFWFLAGILLFLRERLEKELGWGFQLQEPIFVFGLAAFLFIFALSLSGVLEFGLSLTGVGSKASRADGYFGSFFSGILATIVATPCMAPFLGVAVGAALTMKWFEAYLIFSFVAIGLAMPYLILSIFPGWISKLPKPGAWMDTFKQFMAFPLYATVAWLLWTLQSLL